MHPEDVRLGHRDHKAMTIGFEVLCIYFKARSYEGGREGLDISFLVKGLQAKRAVKNSMYVVWVKNNKVVSYRKV